MENESGEKNSDYSEIQNHPNNYLKNTFPKLYTTLEKRFNDFISKWEKVISFSPFPQKLKEYLFFYFCQNISLEIYFDEGDKRVIDMVEKNQIPPHPKYKENLEKLLLLRIINYQFGIPELILMSLKGGISGLESNIRGLNNERIVVTSKILKLLKDKRKLSDDAKKPSKSELQRLADETRKKNRKINFSAIARKLGRSHPTVRVWCENERIT